MQLVGRDLEEYRRLERCDLCRPRLPRLKGGLAEHVSGSQVPEDHRLAVLHCVDLELAVVDQEEAVRWIAFGEDDFPLCDLYSFHR